MFFLGEARYTSGDFLLCPIREHARHHWKQCIAPRIDQKSVTRPLRSQSPNRVGSSPLGPPISSAAARLSSVGVDLLSSAARTSSIVTSSNGLATCGGFMRGLSLAGGAAAGTSELIRRTLIVSPHRARGNRATLMTSICFFETSPGTPRNALTGIKSKAKGGFPDGLGRLCEFMV